ncbi:70 kDa neurofilament protein-like [Haliotis rubra]|uniref:70 kDa neurofilament protein-like n=1 Tax=Haliotis rubra TaxID=36100 RepID=UPI001EE60ED3|nr:70 kDa neurofilament protein-like [Haliotis rubra]
MSITNIIWAKGSSASAGLNDLVFRDADSWGTGSNITTTLLNNKNEEKACHIQNASPSTAMSRHQKAHRLNLWASTAQATYPLFILT